MINQNNYREINEHNEILIKKKGINNYELQFICYIDVK